MCNIATKDQMSFSGCVYKLNFDDFMLVVNCFGFLVSQSGRCQQHQQLPVQVGQLPPLPKMSALPLSQPCALRFNYRVLLEISVASS